MSHVFISYKREDEARVSLLVDVLKRGGLAVWWDKQIPATERWRERILTELESANCVLVVWSQAATSPEGDFVRDEAQRAKKRGTLLQLRIDDVPLPLGFGEYQALDLIGWKGDRSDRRLTDIIDAAKARIEGGPIPPPAPPRLHRTIIRVGGRIALPLAGAGVLAVVIASPRMVCGIPGVHAICSSIGVGGVPSPAEEALWSRRRAGDCEALRSFLSRFPRGAYAAEAQTRLAAAKLQTEETWVTEEQRVPLVVRSALDPFPSEQAAQADALARAPKEAERACLGYKKGAFQLHSARAVREEWRCTQRLGGHACGFDGEAVCQVKALHTNRIEACP